MDYMEAAPRLCDTLHVMLYRKRTDNHVAHPHKLLGTISKKERSQINRIVARGRQACINDRKELYTEFSSEGTFWL